jgi:hypothetical protein
MLKQTGTSSPGGRNKCILKYGAEQAAPSLARDEEMEDGR